jgi:molybdopterin-binding protein
VAAEELDLKITHEALAIIKTSDVMMAIPTEARGQQWFA